MAQNEISTGFSQYSPRRLERVAFGNFAGSTIDQFTDPIAQNPSNYLNLLNVLPTISGAFHRRWGLTIQESISRTTPYVRMFTYAAAQDTTDPGSVDTRMLLGTDGMNIDVLYDEVGTPVYTFNPFAHTGDVWGVSSRDWFYAGNETDTPWKFNFSQHTTNTNWQWGINDPPGVASTIEAAYQIVLDTHTTPTFPCGVGQGFTTAPTITITPLSGFTGSGATAVATIDGGSIVALTMTNIGNDYDAVPAVYINGVLTTSLTAVVGSDSTDTSTYGKVISIVMSGNMILNQGRQYAIALKNSFTGHVGSFIPAQNPFRYPLEANSSYLFNDEQKTWSLNMGVDVINLGVTLTFPSTPDPQVDTVILMATSDGGDLEHLYEVMQIPLSSLSRSGNTFTLTYADTLPDTVSLNYLTGPTLTTNNLWVDVDANNNIIGIFENEPPPSTIGKFVSHKGRIFGTDGKSLYFSKSIDEVTTSTGLITSKWEEAWPPTNVLDIAYDLEEIKGLLSDGEVLYMGTTDNIYRLLGDNSQNFSIPGTIFRGVGIQSQDTWSVVYKDNVPAGYMWVTPDNKIMLSDFNTYNEVGKPIYPILGEFPISSVESTSYGPYSFSLFSVQTGTNPTFLIYDNKTNGWYEWSRELPASGTNPPVPLFTYTQVNGIEKVMIVVGTTSGTVGNSLQFFDPSGTSDAALPGSGAIDIPWMIETSWINLQDTASTIVLNELEVWTDDATTNVTVVRANNPADFTTPVVVKTGPLVTGPLTTQKLYLAGSNSVGRYHKVTFFTNTGTGLSTTSNVLRQFQFEHFPQTRI